MSIIGSTDIADGSLCVLVNHDPKSVATDVKKGSLIIDGNGKMYRKMDDGPTTNVCGVAAHKCNNEAIVPPTVDDDSTDGYDVGSRWFDVTAEKEYVCINPAEGAAVWKETTGAGSGDTLPVVDTTPVVKGSVDPTKLVRIEADGLTADTTRVLSMPDSDITPDDASASRTPTAHKDSHKSGGGDAFTASDLLESPVKRIRTTDGPTDMVVGDVADGEVLQRSGATIVGTSAAGLPVIDTTPVVKGSGDETKQVRIEADGITSGQTRVLSMPDADITPDDASASRTPTSHAASHQDGGGDEIGVGGLSGALADPQTPTSHAASHQDGGADEIGVGGLSGTLADPQTPTAHASAHQDGGADEMSVANLNGVLADAQTPAAHDLAGDKHSADVLADLNAKVTDADLVALAGQLGGTAASPDVRGVRETGGPTLLTIGSIADGEYARRSGSALVGDTPAGGGDVTAAAALGDHRLIRGDGGVKGVQDSGITVDDSDNLTGVGTVNAVDVAAHAARHQDGGADEISVAALSGELADPQPPKAHKANHVSGGGDPFAATDVLEAIVKRLQVTGPVTLLIGAVTDGQYLKRSGTAIVGDTPSGGSGESYVDRGDPSAVDFSIGSGLTADGTWRTLDLSSIVDAAGASKLVHLRGRIMDNTVEALMKMRKLGNTNEINAFQIVTAVRDDSMWFDAWIIMDSSRRIQYNIMSGMDTCELTVAGWME